jgi:hypothetical protein
MMAEHIKHGRLSPAAARRVYGDNPPADLRVLYRPLDRDCARDVYNVAGERVAGFVSIGDDGIVPTTPTESTAP